MLLVMVDLSWLCVCKEVGRACVQGNLRQAFAIEKDMGYMEPPRQYQPTKHCLGYVLMRAGNNQTAAEVLSFPLCMFLSSFLSIYITYIILYS